MCVIFFFCKQKTAYEMRISDWSSDVCSSDLATVQAADHSVQEGARQFVIAAGPDGAAIEINAQNAVDLSRETNGDVLLLATLRLDAAPSAPVSMGVRCDGAECGRPLHLPEVAALVPGQWRVLGVPLQCFAATGADLTRLTPPFPTGREPCRERGWRYGLTSVVAAS